MFYEEMFIDGVLHYRTMPDGKWYKADLDKLSRRLHKAEKTIKDLERNLNDLSRNAQHAFSR